MIRSTTIARLDGLILAASMDDEAVEYNPDPPEPHALMESDSKSGQELEDIKNKVKQLLRRIDSNSASEASIESDRFMIHYIINTGVVFLCICDQSYPRKLAFTYLSDLAQEFTTIYPSQQFNSSTCRPYAYIEFDSFIQKTRKTYQDSRATQNLDKLNDELKDVTKVMTKNIEDLLYRGDSLDKMGDMSSRLRDDSLKYRRAAVRINWELLLKQYGPFAGVGLLILILLWWRFF